MKHKIKILLLRLLPKKTAHKLIFKKYMGENLNLKNPKTLNEKIQWLILNEYGQKEGKLSDKNMVKKYIESLKIENLNIPKTILTFKDINEFYKYETALPNEFVLKTNHGSGDVYIVNDKNRANVNQYLRKLKNNLSESYVNNKLEYHYSYIDPVIMVEEYLNDNSFERPLDYKFFCYNGYVDCVMVCSSRGANTKKDFFDKNWNHLDYSKKKLWSLNPIAKPKNLNEMFEIVSKISKNFPFVRIDLYNINGKIYFGEMTFTPAAGISSSYTKEGDLHLGKFIDIEKIKNCNK